MKEYATYIFDLDGTLLNTLDDLAASCNHALRIAGMPERSREEVRLFVGNGVKKLMERAIPDGLENPKFDEVYASFRQHYLEHGLEHTQPYDGVLELLAELKRQGKHLAIVSNKFYKATEELAHHFFSDTISVAIGEREGINKKPAPDTVFEALRQLSVGKENAIYIGDSDVDIMTAKNCEIPCASVLWGFRDEAFLRQHGGTLFFNHPLELLPDKKL